MSETIKSFVDDEIFNVPRWLPPDRLANAKVLAHRNVILEMVPKGGVVAEVGTYHGDFARRILDTAQPDQIHIFDITFSRFKSPSFESELASGKMILHEGSSPVEMAKLLPAAAGSFDWIYIDGDHTYEGVVADIEQAMQLIKQDGLLIFNDYMVYSPLERMQYGVARAVNDLIVDQGFEMIYFALEGMSYYDVAVRRL